VLLTETFNSALVQSAPKKKKIKADMIALKYSDKRATIISELHGFSDRLAEVIYPQVRIHFDSNHREIAYTPTRFDDDLESHLEPMLAAVPPIESSRGGKGIKPTDFAAVLNVGWTALLTRLPELRVATEENTERAKLEVLHGLLLKAVELSEIRRQWENAR
jgi:hypothetical protein